MNLQVERQLDEQVVDRQSDDSANDAHVEEPGTAAVRVVPLSRNPGSSRTESVVEELASLDQKW